MLADIIYVLYIWISNTCDKDMKWRQDVLHLKVKQGKVALLSLYNETNFIPNISALHS